MPSKTILELDVGGQLFKTNIQTICKYPGSMLCAMFSHTDSGMTPMPKTEKGHFFLDADPIYFRVVLNWLRFGKVALDNPGLLKGTMALAEYFGLEELTKQLKQPSPVERSYETVDETIEDNVRHLEEALSNNPNGFVILGHLRNAIKLSGGYAINKLAAKMLVDKCSSLSPGSYSALAMNDFTIEYYINAIKDCY